MVWYSALLIGHIPAFPRGLKEEFIKKIGPGVVVIITIMGSDTVD